MKEKRTPAIETTGVFSVNGSVSYEPVRKPSASDVRGGPFDGHIVQSGYVGWDERGTFGYESFGSKIEANSSVPKPSVPQQVFPSSFPRDIQRPRTVLRKQ